MLITECQPRCQWSADQDVDRGYWLTLNCGCLWCTWSNSYTPVNKRIKNLVIIVISFVYSLTGYYYKVDRDSSCKSTWHKTNKDTCVPDCHLNNWNCISYLRHPISPEAFFNLITPSSSVSSSEGCPEVDVAVLWDSNSGEDGIESSGGDPILMNDNPNCLSILKGWRQITLTRSHWLSSACLENASAKEVFHYNSSKLITFSSLTHWLLDLFAKSAFFGQVGDF